MSRPVLAVLAALAVLASALAPAASAATPEYFPLPESRGIGQGIVADPAGNVWFAGAMVSPETVPPLGRLVPSAASPGSSDGISFFPTPTIGEGCCANFIRDVAFDAANGRVWFVRSTGAVGFGVVSAMVPGQTTGLSAVKVPGGVDLGGIAVAPGGTAWFTENGATSSPDYYGNRAASTDSGLGISELPTVAHYTTGSFESIRYDAKPKGITIDPSGSPWFTEESSGNPGYRLAKIAGGSYQEHLLQPCAATPPCSGAYSEIGPTSVAAALDGTIWFTNEFKNAFGKFDPKTETVTQYALTDVDPTFAGAKPRSIRLAQDGTLWLAENGYVSKPNANAIVRIVPSDPPTTTVYKLSGTGANEKPPISVAADAAGNVWFAVGPASGPGFVGRLAAVVGEPATPITITAPPGETKVKATSSGVAKTGEVLAHESDIWAKQICVGPPQDKCSLIYLLDSHEYVNGFPGTKPRLATASGGRKTRRVVVGRKAVTIAGGKTVTVKIKLNAKGKKILKRDGVLHLTFHATQKLGKRLKTVKTKKLTIAG